MQPLFDFELLMVAVDSQMHSSLRLFRFTCLYSLLFLPVMLSAQEVPPFRYFAAQDYHASAQNWKITHSDDGTLFFANNDGVVVAQAGHWELLPSVNQSIVRSVFFDDGLLYVGMYMEFGYYKRDISGTYAYTSLSRRLKDGIREDEQFWNIFRIGDQVIFQSLDQIKIYLPDQDSLTVLEPPQPILQGFTSRQRLFIQDVRHDLYELTDGTWSRIAQGSALQEAQIVLVDVLSDGSMRLVDEWGRIFGNGNMSWSVIKDLGLRSEHVYSADRLADQGFVLGTISDGIRVYSQSWDPVYALGGGNGIRNNTVLSLHQDAGGNLWLGLDNGLICVNHQAPLKSFMDQENALGTIYATADLDGWEYLGTNIGLFCRRRSGQSSFQLIPGSSGQVWSLQRIGDRLLMGHHKGAFVVNGDRLEPTGAYSGTWTFIPMPDAATLLAGTYQGIDVLRLKNGRWQWSHKVSGFSLSSRHLEPVSRDTWLVSHEYKGVFLLKTDPEWKAVTQVKVVPDSGKRIHSSLAGFNGSVWYHCPEGLFRFDAGKEVLVRQEWADEVLDTADYYSGRMVAVGDDALCFFRSDALIMMRREVTEDAFRFDILPVSVERLKPMRGFENLSLRDNSRLLLGGVNQYIQVDTDVRFPNPPEPSVFGCTAEIGNQPGIPLPLNEPLVPGVASSVRIRFGSPFHQAYQEVRYRYRLSGVSEVWSDWTPEEELVFNRLPAGDHILELQASSADRQPSEVVRFTFSVERHWALKPGMILMFGVAVLLTILTIHRSYTGYYRRQRRRLIEENEKNLRLGQLTLEQDYAKERNAFLQDQFELKKRELAQTMIHLNKNVELLAEVRSHLQRLKGEENQRLLQKIDGNLADEDAWTLLETAFNQVDPEFLNKIRTLYPDFSPSDLKLCVYLRLNLSGKEISTLLNISTKSVEIKRYRLRKKMGLEPQVSLQQYILGL